MKAIMIATLFFVSTLSRAQVVGYFYANGTAKAFTVKGNTNSATAVTAYTYNPSASESGLIDIKLITVDASINSKTIERRIRFKRVNNTVTISNTTALYTNAEALLNTADVTAVASGTSIQIRITGIAAMLSHTMEVKITSAVYGQ